MFLSSLAIAAALLGSPQPPQTVIPPAQAATTPATAEGIEILRRILADAVDKALARDQGDPAKNVRFGDPDVHVRGLVTRLWISGRVVTHSRAFHVPGRGVFVSMDVEMPTVSRQPVAEERAPEAGHDDEWNRMRRQVRGAVGDRPFFVAGPQASSVELEIDPQAVRTLTDTIVTALGRHASRIEGLDPQASFTVALHLSGSHQTAWTNWSSLGTEGGPEDSAGEAFVLALGAEVPEQNLVLELSLADVRREGQDGARLGERVRTNLY